MTTDTNITLYENCCRTCMKEDSLMFDLFIERLESSNLADMLIACTKLKIHKDDSLPRQVCRYCYNCIISFSHFCNMAQKAEEKLREAMLCSDNVNRNNSQGETYEIKIEFNGNDNFIESQSEETEMCHIVDENKNSNVSVLNNTKVGDIKITEKLNCVCCNKKFKNISKVECQQQKHNDKNMCTICAATGEHNNELTIKNEHPHASVINESKATSDLICIICSSRFKSMNLLSVHLRKHENDQVNSCNECGRVFKKASHLKRHKTIHKDNEFARSVNRKSIPKENVNANIYETNSSNAEQRFQCSICWTAYKNINSLSAHMRKHTEKGRVISCRECKKVFKKLSHLKRHELQHDVNCPYKCSVCPKSFPTEELLKDHVNKHKGVKPHSCPVCGKKFSHLSTLTSHIKIHTRDKAFLCPTCGKKFDSSTNLNQHILRHMGLKEFACTLCPKRFVSKGELKSHTVTHTGERAYTCDQCGATFTKRSSLAKHKTRHLGLKPHQCDTCLMRFTCKSHLNRHYRIHTGEKPYKCDMCDRAFTQSNDLVKHRRAHVGDKVYKCSQCSEGFRLHAELRQHISEHFISSRTVAASGSNEQSTDGVGSKDLNTNVTLPHTVVMNDNGCVDELQKDSATEIKS